MKENNKPGLSDKVQQLILIGLAVPLWIEQKLGWDLLPLHSPQSKVQYLSNLAMEVYLYQLK